MSQQMLVNQNSPGVGRKLCKCPVLDIGKLERTTVEAHWALSIVDGQVAQDIGLGRLWRLPPEQGEVGWEFLDRLRSDAWEVVIPERVTETGL